ncbi:MAG: response regulator [Deltaproteobacteria bacterium]|nr:response regulator [Deltaproteobacteria bacterium]MBM4302680.1 response regulator [Deltaproteobacteria bacterium]
MNEPYAILVVDDEKVLRDGCTLILKPEGYRVLTAMNGQEALETLASETVNVVLCDLKMPVMGALEVLEQASALHPGIPVIIMTGLGTVADAVECMKKGAYDFVTKPFSIDHLILVVKRALEKHLLEQQTRQLQEEQARNLYNLAMEQSRMHTIVNCMADGVLVTNREGEVVLCNATLLQLLGVNAPPAQPGPLQDYLDDPDFKRAIDSLLAGDHPDRGKLIAQELCQNRLHLRSLSAPFYGPDSQVLGTVTVFHDITSFKELDEMKNDFVRMVSHELRSPLAAIKQQHAVILDGLAGELTGKQRELLTRAHAKIQGLLDLINDLLDLTKMEAGYGQLEQVPLDLRETLGEMVELLRERAASQKIVLQLDIPAAIPLIQADRRSMEEVFTNLVSNAINYSPDGGEVRIAAISHGDYLEVVITDQGIGIEPEELPKIFDKFYRVKSPQTRQVIGTGLGLALVKGLIEAHRGAVEAESVVGMGTTFRVKLPTVGAAKGVDARK